MSNRILIVDDSKFWQLFNRKLIEKMYGGLFEITIASSATEALSKIKQNRFNPFALIITDLQMELDYEPLSAGEWLIENIKSLREYQSVNIVIISSMYNIEQTAKDYGVDCISKRMLSSNELLMKYMFEKLMPFLTKIDN